MIDWVLFGVLAVVTLGAGFKVVSAEDLVHVVLWLAVTLLGTAGFYALLDAGFLAAIQVLLYTGGVITLMLFAVLLARRTGGFVRAGGVAEPARAVVVALATAGLSAFAILRGAPESMAPTHIPPKVLGGVLLGPLALPFEALSVLLLGAMIGAIVLARRKEA